MSPFTDTNVGLIGAFVVAIYLMATKKGTALALPGIAVLAAPMTSHTWYSGAPLWAQYTQEALVWLLVIGGMVAYATNLHPPYSKARTRVTRICFYLATLVAYTFPLLVLLFSGASVWTVVIVLGIGLIALIVSAAVAGFIWYRRETPDNPYNRRTSDNIAPVTPAGPRAADYQAASTPQRGPYDPDQVRRQRPQTGAPQHRAHN
ncbi:MAG TPA: hypothetical protein VLA88_06795 [Candidatus Saccharimonadales bacterium]|nr:hypothetical protein [Candidatus Saccharimonadales bacterium]